MLRKILTLSFLLLSMVSITYAQVNFEKGYIITKDGKKQECLIKNKAWRDSPKQIKYKQEGSEEVYAGDVNSIKEFSVYNQLKFVSEFLAIDMSGVKTDNLSYSRDPDYQQKTVFLESIIDGEVKLYKYQNGEQVQFFYQKGEGSITPLIYKRYIKEVFKITENVEFRAQLLEEFQDEEITILDVKDLVYNEKQLKKFFLKYLDLSNTKAITYEVKNTASKFHLGLTIGVGNSSFGLNNNVREAINGLNFDDKIQFRVGMIAEVFLPFGKNKWSVLTEPTFQYYNDTKDIEALWVNGNHLTFEVDYKSIELPIGIRYYFYLNEKSKLYINGSILVDLPISSSINLIRKDQSVKDEFKIKFSYVPKFGIGYIFNDKYGVSTEYQLSRNLLINASDVALSWTSNYNVFSFSFSYYLK